jgi:hypothetical protein
LPIAGMNDKSRLSVVLAMMNGSGMLSCDGVKGRRRHGSRLTRGRVARGGHQPAMITSALGHPFEAADEPLPATARALQPIGS